MQDQSTSGSGNPAAGDDGLVQGNTPTVAAQNFDASTYLKAYIEKAKLVALQPHVFFANMPTTGGYKEPLMFYGTGLLAYALLAATISLSPVVFIVTIVVSLVASFAASGLAYGLSKAMGGKPQSFEAVYRVYAYAGVVLLGCWVPFVGGLVALYGWVLQYFGLKEVCKLDTVRTIALCVISGILAMVAAGIAALAVAIKTILPF